MHSSTVHRSGSAFAACRITSLMIAALLIVHACSRACGADAAPVRTPSPLAEVLVEAESFGETGGWVVDSQFIELMGSPYLLAHGLGKPVANAKAQVEFPVPGTYHVWVRAKDWVPSHHPGRFKLLINGNALASTFGENGRDWSWERGGSADIAGKSATVELKDLAGFDGRCDAIFFTTDPGSAPPEKVDEQAAWRRKLRGLPPTPPAGGEFDVVVVGGGMAGCAAAITASRLGCRVALVQDRPYYGGNNSPEIRVHSGPWGIPGEIVAPEIDGNYGHSVNDPKWWDPAKSGVEAAQQKRHGVIDAEKNIRQFLGWRVYGATKNQNRITSVDAREVLTGKEVRIAAPVFIDCTGDGWVGYYAGADFRHGQEGRGEHNEPLAPEQPIKMTLGSSLFWYSAPGGGASTFPDVPWATAVSKGLAATSGNWTWEYGHYRDTIWEGEAIRDHLFCAIYGAFSTAKQKEPAKYGSHELRRVNYIIGKRESRRLMGDYIMTQADCWTDVKKPDKVAIGGNPFDLHVPSKDRDFIIHVDPRVSLKERRQFEIPLRCLYSKNVENLFMAGRCISATRIAHAAMRIQHTGAQTGVAVGAAAFLCKKHSTTPRGVYQGHIGELQEITFAQGAYQDALRPGGPKP